MKLGMVTRRRRMMLRALLGIVPALSGTFLALRASGATVRTWNNASGGNWSTAGNWTPSAVPGSGDSLTITESGTSNIAINYDYAGSAVTFNDFLLNDASAVGNATTTLNITANTLTATDEYVGYSITGSNSSGTVNQSGGNNTTNFFLYLAYNPGDKGFYNLSGNGALSANIEDIGYQGQGTFVQSGNSNNTLSAGLYIGVYTSATNGSGSYSLSGNAALNANGVEMVGYETPGVFNQTGGSNTNGASQTLFIGYSGTGTYNLSGNNASLTENGVAEDIGYLTTGSMNQSGGTNTLAATAVLNIGSAGGVTGNYALSGTGILLSNGNENIGAGGIGNFNQTGGINTISNSANAILFVGEASGSTGTYTMSGGVLNAQYAEDIGYQGTGIFNQSGGINNIGSGGFGVGFSSAATYNLSGTGVINTAFEVVGFDTTGTLFNQTGGTNNAQQLVLAEFAETSGTYNLSGGSLLVGSGGISMGFGGAAVMTVSGTGILTSAGTISLTSAPGTSLNLNGGTINIAALATFGVPSLFNWTTGTLNITSDTIWDSGAANTTASDAFGAALSLTNGQIFEVTGNETLGGSGSFTLTLNAGSTHYVSGTITITPSGTLTQNGGTLYASTITQAGGTINGTLQNQGQFIYQGGLFNARLLNQGTVSLGPSFTAVNGIENDASLSISNGQTLTINGQGLDNLGTFDFNGGTINGTGALLNDFGGIFYAEGTMSQAFNNEGTLYVDGIIRFNGGATNVGSLAGSGTIIGAFANSAGGSIGVTEGYSLSINNTWSNAGLVIQTGGTLGGGAITNTGTIEGTGAVNASVLNTTGVIRATDGELDMKGTGNTNAAGAQIQITVGSTVMFTQGLATNAGTIALSGGAFDNNNQPLSNTGTISGNGIIRTGGLTNAAAGLVLLTDTASSVYGPVTNNGHIHIVNNTTTFYGNVNNASGTIEVTGSTARFLGNGVSMTVGGSYISDPSSNYFNGLAIINGGLVSGGVGDAYYVTGNSNFTNAGTFTNAGSLAAYTVTNTGTFTETGALTETGNFVNSGAATIAGAQTWSAGTSFTNTSGTVAFDTDAGSAASSPLAVISSGGTIIYNANQHLGSIAINGSGKVDLVGNELFISSTPAATIRSYIAEAYDKGRWDLSGLTSSLAASNVHASTAVGYMASGSQVLVKYTWYGDANLDGIVNGADLAMISSTGTTWSSGDFNYDGVVNADDYALFMLGSTYGGSANISTTLPEPASALALLAAGAMLSRKRR